MAEIKAIETIYNGYKFRSRLEARWAVFFTEAGIKYQYEPEGYVFDNGECYLPDFYIPDCLSPICENLFVEVKASTPTLDEREKAKRLSMATKTPVLIVSQIPNIRAFKDGEGELHLTDINGDDLEVPLEGLDTVSADVFEDTWMFVDGRDWGCGLYIDICPYVLTKSLHNALLVLGLEIVWAGKAYRKARQARFEYGEKG